MRQQDICYDQRENMMYVTDRNDRKHLVNRIKLTDLPKVVPYIKRCCYMILFGELSTYFPKSSKVVYDDEVFDNILPYLANNTENFDLQMLKQALTYNVKGFLHYSQLKPNDGKTWLDISGTDISSMIKTTKSHEERQELKNTIDSLVEQGKLPKGTYVTDNLTVGTTLTDNKGNEHKAYSMLLTEYDKVMSMLVTIDSDVSKNTGEQRKTMLELVKIALNYKYTVAEIEEFADDNFCDHAIHTLLDLPLE